MSLGAYLKEIREDRQLLPPRCGTASKGRESRGRCKQWLSEYVGTRRSQGAVTQSSLYPCHSL